MPTLLIYTNRVHPPQPAEKQILVPTYFKLMFLICLNDIKNRKVMLLQGRAHILTQISSSQPRLIFKKMCEKKCRRRMLS